MKSSLPIPFPLSTNLQENIELLLNKLGTSSDVIIQLGIQRQQLLIGTGKTGLFLTRLSFLRRFRVKAWVEMLASKHPSSYSLQTVIPFEVRFKNQVWKCRVLGGCLCMYPIIKYNK